MTSMLLSKKQTARNSSQELQNLKAFSPQFAIHSCFSVPSILILFQRPSPLQEVSQSLGCFLYIIWKTQLLISSRVILVALVGRRKRSGQTTRRHQDQAHQESVLSVHKKFKIRGWRPDSDRKCRHQDQAHQEGVLSAHKN
jgi:hypothetical protein